MEHIQDVETSIQSELDLLLQSPYNPCIHKVPEYISKGNKDNYKPLIVSIGPWYHNDPTLKSTHELKIRHLKCFLETSSHAYSLSHYIDIIRGWEDKARSYYAEKISLSSNEFIKMVMVDAAFIIYLFMWFYDKFMLKTHPIEDNYEVLHQVYKDLFLVENQLPYFILHDLYNIAYWQIYPNIKFIEVTGNFISGTFFPGREAARTIGSNIISEASNVKHLVDFLRICCLPTKLRDQLPTNLQDNDTYPPTAKELKAAGVQFVASESKNLLDITFSKKGVLKIPKLMIEDNTEAILRNIMFYEQYSHYEDSYFIDYVFFLDELIDTEEDVRILIDSKIIENFLGSDDMVAKLFNQVAKQVMIASPGFFYNEVSEDLTAHVSVKWNQWKAVLSRDYFNHPWSIISLVYLVLLLILTVLQVYTGFKS